MPELPVVPNIEQPEKIKITWSYVFYVIAILIGNVSPDIIGLFHKSEKNTDSIEYLKQANEAREDFKKEVAARDLEKDAEISYWRNLYQHAQDQNLKNDWKLKNQIIPKAKKLDHVN